MSDERPAVLRCSSTRADLPPPCSALMAALSGALNRTEHNLVQVSVLDGSAGHKLDAVMADAHKLQWAVQQLLEQVEVIRNSDARGE